MEKGVRRKLKNLFKMAKDNPMVKKAAKAALDKGMAKAKGAIEGELDKRGIDNPLVRAGLDRAGKAARSRVDAQLGLGHCGEGMRMSGSGMRMSGDGYHY